MKNSTKKKTIGILGGIGPEATGDFFLSLISKIQVKSNIKSSVDFPRIIVNSISAPELIHNTVTEEELEPYIKGIKSIEKFGVDFIIMICNTIHVFHGKLQNEISVPILDLKKVVHQNLLKNRVKSIAVLATPATIKKGLFSFENIDTVVPNEKEMKTISEAIFNFNIGVDKEKQSQTVKNIASVQLDKGVETILLGCTEIALMLKDEELPKINTMDVLVDATLSNLIK